VLTSSEKQFPTLFCLFGKLPDDALENLAHAGIATRALPVASVNKICTLALLASMPLVVHTPLFLLRDRLEASEFVSYLATSEERFKHGGVALSQRFGYCSAVLFYSLSWYSRLPHYLGGGKADAVFPQWMLRPRKKLPRHWIGNSGLKGGASEGADAGLTERRCGDGGADLCLPVPGFVPLVWNASIMVLLYWPSPVPPVPSSGPAGRHVVYFLPISSRT
jgi:hypothetical protein